MAGEKRRRVGNCADGKGIMDALILIAAVYMLPTMNALLRRHANTGAIATLNVLLGWTVLGWIGAVVWSMTCNVRPEVRKAKPGVWGSFTHKPKKVIEEKVVTDWKPGQDF